MQKFRFVLFLVITTSISTISCQKPYNPESVDYKTGTVQFTFVNSVKAVPLELNTGVYATGFGEPYTVSKFKYYISNIQLNKAAESFKEKTSYHLIDQKVPASMGFTFSAPVNGYTSVQFMLGVDSVRNVSGAQTGALDPLNDMFWTWNSGYIMAKMEGNSPVSTQVNNKVEYHIGGFSGANNVLKQLIFNLPANLILDIRERKTSEIIIEADLDAWWQSPNDMKFSVNPVCTTPGALARQVSDNYSKMFTIRNVINY